jgi:hypothetical protein
MNKRRTQRPSNLPVFPCKLCELDDLVDVVLRRPGSDPGFTRVENTMRRIVIAFAATLAILAAGSITPNRAAAMTVTTPSGMQNALNENSLLQDVQVDCRRGWRCGPYGCGWHQIYWRAAPYYGSYRPYYGLVVTR